MTEVTKEFDITPLSPEEYERVRKDLQFIDLATKVGKELGFRVIIHGGYAVDGNLGVITRPHKDLDIQVYGNESNPQDAVHKLLAEIKKRDATFQTDPVEDKERQEYYHNLLIRRSDAVGIDLYYLQVTTDPFGQEKIIVKKDGSLSDTQSFGVPNIVTLEGISFETVDPVSELSDELYKREHKGYPSQAKHDQDINNLRLITDPEKVKQRLEELVNRV